MISYNRMRYKSILLGLLGLSSQAVFSDTLPIACTPAALTAAITAANNADNSTGSGLVILAPGCVYVIQTPATVNDALPVITGNVVIVGGEGSVIARSASAANFRIFEVNAGASLTLRNLAVENGNINDIAGGVFVNGTLIAQNVRFSHNSANEGGAIAVGDVAGTGATAKIIDSNFFFNAAPSGIAGGISNYNSLEITNSRFTGNSSHVGGGAIASSGGVLNINRSVFTNNNADGGDGGALLLSSTTHINNSLIASNSVGQTGGEGGGINYSNTTLTLKHTQVINNTPNNCFPVNTINGCVN